VDDRPQARNQALEPEAFEHLASFAARETEGLRFELIGGKLGVKAVPDGLHSEIVLWLQRVCMQYRPDLGLYAHSGLAVETYRAGRARPDGTLAPIGHFVGAGEWAEPDGVLMTVEVPSFDRDTTQRDRVEKPRAYAESAIPVYLLIDRDTREVTVHSEPGGGVYQRRVIVPFGKTVSLPEPVSIELDTEQLLTWVQGEGA
jgi:Uma2 family endonuclease